MKKLFISTLLAIGPFSAFSQIVYQGNTFNAVHLDTAFADSIQIHTTINVLVYSTVITKDCFFKAAKSKTWLQIEAIIEEKSEQCFNNDF